MDRLQIKASLVLAKKYRDNGKVSYDWNERDLHCNDPTYMIVMKTVGYRTRKQLHKHHSRLQMGLY